MVQYVIYCMCVLHITTCLSWSLCVPHTITMIVCVLEFPVITEPCACRRSGGLALNPVLFFSPCPFRKLPLKEENGKESLKPDTIEIKVHSDNSIHTKPDDSKA